MNANVSITEAKNDAACKADTRGFVIRDHVTGRTVYAITRDGAENARRGLIKSRKGHFDWLKKTVARH